MSDKNNSSDSAKDTLKAIAKEAYQDGAKPVVKPAGELIGLLPRTIKAALAPLERWILQREYNIEETKKLLEEKLKNVPPESIEPPEAHIAVPALQYISYCMDNVELRDMYANLLASSMNKVVKKGVHPGFVEIIKQLCPDEAKILRYLSKNITIPTITLRYEDNKGAGVDIIRNFSNVGELTQCENPRQVGKYFDNLIRLGLLETPGELRSLTNKSLYASLKLNPYILYYTEKELVERCGYKEINFVESLVQVTDYGEEFCGICITK